MHLKSVPKDIKIPLACADHVIRSATSMRVSDCAALEMSRVLESIGKKIALQAMEAAKHAKRETIRGEDIEYVIRSGYD